MTSTIRPLYFDCDTGIDDSMALVYLAKAPEISLVGVGTVSGNTNCEQAAENTLSILEAMGRTDVPVAVGSHDFLTSKYTWVPTHIHGDNGIGNVELPTAQRRPEAESASDMLLRLSHEYAGELEVVAVGPSTNLALALQKDPELATRVKRVVLMGGAAREVGNASVVAEANVFNDPEAAQTVMAAPWEQVWVPLDVTLANILEEEHRARLLASPKREAQIVGEALDVYFNFYLPEYGRRCSALHDPLAAAVAVGAIKPTIWPVVEAEVDITDGPGRGQSLFDLRLKPRNGWQDTPGGHIRVVLEVEKSFPDHLTERLSA
ncbi:MULTISPECIES: nucleoside hydrolase [Actinotignum]|uniref:Nucleoside hydrolase n=1 Tax=Actinotignum timonense TaxID=1870995 RepID=A0ABU5GFK6_9ACTO|nr:MULTISPECIES: nucleoside hydrolase [Actinotignum]MDE1559150.1 nucleoside hydrolase [Actinotignum schaalii]MDE1664161.1 nucleoside hydrolase [Actinotignum schaalii]MDK6373290.1 nucleoside hydrolase [Actinotignum timonense]MDK6419849.1 nucleoside hydrolase [Actinotignum timonense]MDK6590788.1 nucleoside hydrolase [Actinotignum timonense]